MPCITKGKPQFLKSMQLSKSLYEGHNQIIEILSLSRIILKSVKRHLLPGTRLLVETGFLLSLNPSMVKTKINKSILRTQAKMEMQQKEKKENNPRILFQ